MQDAAYKNLFSHPRMVEDLLRGFAARGWSERLDLSTLEKLSAEFVSDDFRQRRGDGLWRVRFHDDTWLYLVAHLEFQSTVDRYMALRMLLYTGLLYQDRVRREELGPNGELPPVLPVVLYNGPSRWTAAEDVAELIALAGEALACYIPSGSRRMPRSPVRKMLRIAPANGPRSTWFPSMGVDWIARRGGSFGVWFAKDSTQACAACPVTALTPCEAPQTDGNGACN